MRAAAQPTPPQVPGSRAMRWRVILAILINLALWGAIIWGVKCL